MTDTRSGASAFQRREIDDFMARALRGEAIATDTLPCEPAALVERAIFHGVSALLLESGENTSWLPANFGSALRAQVLQETMWDLRHRQVLIPVLEDLADAGLLPILLKGTALAYAYYALPALRPRGDTDILIDPAHRSNAREILRRHEFVPYSPFEAATISEETWTFTAADGSQHHLDVHWNLMSDLALGDLFSNHDLAQHSVPVPRLCASAKMLSPCDALLHACIHRAKHFKSAYFVAGEASYDGDRLIWHYDIMLLSRRMSPSDWERFCERSRSMGIEPICASTLKLSRDLLGANIPAAVQETLELGTGCGRAFEYLTYSSLAGRILQNVRMLPDGRSRLKFLRSILLPTEAVLRSEFPNHPKSHALILHVRRYLARASRMARRWRDNRSRRQ
ncbi:nucleotidyltransferase family protein [Sedimentimonas flavescens]|uniref:Nucleotidyltransferase family protein n=1 Tax=Sedimentimonas flavescens TaxID=2851012 RepID=A0ABT2ZV89_9RHOB|nr:nucleotidyltransferase family protein [Sedimentimonas flavescens]MCV2877662.1 nucleotidyltransferase family protein [Sedimentimonas flavescens]